MGPVFEDYLAWLFKSHASTKYNTYYPSPKYDIGTQMCDAIVICGSTAIMIEAKIGTCRVETKYSGDYVLMKKYLESKLVGTAKDRKGVLQLTKAHREDQGKANLIAAVPSECEQNHSPYRYEG